MACSKRAVRNGAAIAVLAVAAAVASVSVHATVTVVDDAGQTLTFGRPVQRIVSLAPHATELLFAAGAGDRLVGVSAFSDYPAVARVLPQISGGVRLDIEQVLALKPDLAVGWSSGNARSDLDALRRFGIRVFIAEPKKLDDVAATLVKLGQTVGREVEAQAAAEQYRARLAKLREDYRERTPLRVFVMISAQPLMTLNHAHLFQDVLRLCGGLNIFAARDTLASSVSYESVLIEDPDVILFSSSLGTEQAMREWWRERMDLRAVRSGRVYSMPADTTLRQTPRVLDGAARVCAALDAARQPPPER